MVEANASLLVREEAFWTWVGKHSWWMLVALLALNIALKAPYLGGTSLFLDEAVAIHETQGSVAETLEFSAKDPTPPFYYLVLGFWCKIFGISEASARFPSMLFSAATAGMIFLLGRRFFSARAGLYAALLFTLSNVGMNFAHEARAYALAGLLMTCSYYTYLALADAKTRHWRPALVLLVLNALLLYTHYVTAMGIAMQAVLSLWLLRGHLRNWIYYAGSQALVLCLWLPWLMMNRGKIPDSKVTSWLLPPDWMTLRYVFSAFAGDGWLPVFAACLLVGAGGIAIFRYASKRKQDGSGFALSAFAQWLLGATALQVLLSYIYMPVFELRYAMYAFPGACLLIGALVAALPLHALLRNGLVAVYLGMALWHLNLNPPKGEAWREAMAEIKALQTPQSGILVNAYYQFTPFTYYYKEAYFRDFQHTMPLLGNDSIHLGMDSSIVMPIDDSLVTNLIVVLSHDELVDPQGTLVKYLDSKYCLSYRRSFPGIKVLQYKSFPCQLVADGHFEWDYETSRVAEEADRLQLDPTDSISNHVTLLNADHEFSAAYCLPVSEIMNGRFKSLRIRFRAWPADIGKNVKMVFVMDHAGESYNWNGFDLNGMLKTQAWTNAEISLTVSEIKASEDILKVYFWSTEKAVCYFDDLEIDFLD